MNLPEDFIHMMQALLGEEAPAFFESYEKERTQGLRVNTLKTTPQQFLSASGFSLEPIEWSPVGFRYSAQMRPGKHPYHEAGVYYIQEPSAMAAAELLAPESGEAVLDLCAAPGGKSTHIAQKMEQRGLLWSNEINASRAKVLSQNIERMGIRNAVVSNETPKRLADRLPAFFDRVLVDAPCSGEGMFRKDEQARGEWSLENVAHCAERQREILDCAAAMLKPGGRMVYSTCTFNPLENEETINAFLQKHPDFSLLEMPRDGGFSSGRPEWTAEKNAELSKTLRLWPQTVDGEGHFFAVMQKAGLNIPTPERSVSDKIKCKEFSSFAHEALTQMPSGNYLFFGEQLYLAPGGMPDCREIRVLRPGLHLGTVKRNWFQPSHALALAMTPEQAVKHYDLTADSAEISAYLRGEAFSAQGEKGWYLITVDGYSIGWGKLTDGSMKNHYPKGLRRQ